MSTTAELTPLGRIVAEVVPALLVEAFGSFFLVLTIAVNVTGGNILAPIAIGTMLTALVFSGGGISGAHYNPAVTLGFFVTGRGAIKLGMAALYVVVQFAAGLSAASVALLLTDETFEVEPGSRYTVWKAFGAEIVFTFALVLTVLNVASTKAVAGNSYYGLSIGFTVLFSAVTIGPISGAALNPIVAICPTIVHALRDGSYEGLYKYSLVYLAAEIVGSLAAAIAFRIIQEAAEYSTKPPMTVQEQLVSDSRDEFEGDRPIRSY